MDSIGPYRIIGELGRGGMSTVYRAEQTTVRRIVALKVLRSELESDPAQVERFRREAHTAANLQHAHIVKVWDASLDQPPYYFALEFLGGHSVYRRLQRGPMEPAEALHVLGAICSALDYAHAAGIVHRDVKSSNVIFRTDGGAVLTDFGIVQASSESPLTVAGAKFGTPHYMSPEQAKGLPVDHRTDLYSAGVLLYEMLTGQLPFQGDRPEAILYQVVHQSPPKPGSVRSELRKLDGFFEKALAKSPEQRFQSGAQMAAAFSACLATREAKTRGPQLDWSRVRRTAIVAALCVVLVASVVIARALLPSLALGGRLSSRPAAPTIVPSVLHLTAAEARAKARSAKVQIEGPPPSSPDNERPIVTGQTPAAGQPCAPRAAVRLTWSNQLRMPLVRNMGSAAAQQALTNCGFDRIQLRYEPGVLTPGTVMQQAPEPRADQWYWPHDPVTLTVSSGPAVEVPAVVGLSSAQAREAIAAARFALAEPKYAASDAVKGTVISQDPLPGARGKPGDVIAIRISSGAAPVVRRPQVPRTRHRPTAVRRSRSQTTQQRSSPEIPLP